MKRLRSKAGHQGILRPTSRRVQVMTRQGRSKTKKIYKPLGSPGRDRVASQLQGKTNLRLCIQRRLGGIGDVLMTTPVVKALKTRYPECHLTYATDPQYYHGDLIRILEGNPYIDEVVDYRGIDQQAFHLFVDLTGICPPYENKNNPPMNRIDLFARHVGTRLDDPLPDYIIRDDEKQWANKIIQKWFGEGSYKTIVVHTASVDARRTWPVQNYIELITQLAAKRSDLRFIILDQNRKNKTWDYKYCVNASDYGVRQMAALIWAADLFVGPDSGPMHVAGALEKEIVALFGSTHPDARINYYDGAVSVTADIDCLYCWYSVCPHNLQCMRAIPINKVQRAIIQKLDQQVSSELAREYRVKLNIDPTCSLEEQAMTRALLHGLQEMNVNVVADPGNVTDKDLNIDILRTSNLNDPMSGRSPTSALNLCIPMVFEDRLAKEATQRLVSGYDALLCFGRNTVGSIRGSGIPAHAHVISPPVSQSASNKELKATYLTMACEQVTPENLSILIEAIRKYEEISGSELYLRINTFQEKSVKQVHNIVRHEPRIKLRLLQTLDLEYTIWDNAGIYIDLNGYSTGWFAMDAIARGLSVIIGDYKSVKHIPDSLVYRVPGQDEKPLFRLDGKHCGSYLTHDVQHIVDALGTVIPLYETGEEERQRRAQYVASQSQDMCMKRIVSVLQRRLGK